MNEKKSLIPLYITNFLGVFDDNLLKGLISFVSIYWVAKGNESLIIMLATGFLVIPFILFSPFSGFLSKTLNKQKMVIVLKVAEIFIMLLAIIGFWYANIYIVLTAMFLMGLQSTFFSPAKFALVRDIGGEAKSSVGTGTVEMTTFFGVLMGTFTAGILSDIENFRIEFIAAMFLLVTISGLWSALKIKASEPQPLTIHIRPLNFISFIRRKYKWSLINAPGLNTVVYGLSLFWMVASLIQMNLLIHCPLTLGFSNTETGIIMALVAVSIGLGSYISGLVAGDKIEVGLIPIGGLAFILSIFSIFIFNPKGLAFIILIMLAAFTAGFFKTPLNAWMQVNVKGRKLGDAIAYNNLINFIFILFSALLFRWVESTYGSLFVFAVTGGISFYMIVLLSFKLKGVNESIKRIFGKRKTNVVWWHSMLSVLFRCVIRLRYRVVFENKSLVTSQDVKIFFPNHPALIDPVILCAFIYKFNNIAPVISAMYYRISFFNPLLRLVNAIPVADLSEGERDVDVYVKLAKGVAAQIKKGNHVLFYPSGQLASQDFEKLYNKQGAFRIVGELPDDIHIIGVRIKGLWGSRWSKAKTGKTPDILKTLFRSLGWLALRGFLFAPKRTVVFEFVDISKELKALAKTDRKTFNAFLEDFYNEKKAENGEYLITEK